MLSTTHKFLHPSIQFLQSILSFSCHSKFSFNSSSSMSSCCLDNLIVTKSEPIDEQNVIDYLMLTAFKSFQFYQNYYSCLMQKKKHYSIIIATTQLQLLSFDLEVARLSPPYLRFESEIALSTHILFLLILSQLKANLSTLTPCRFFIRLIF